MAKQRNESNQSGSVEFPHIAIFDLETDPFAPGRLEINPFVSGFFDGTSIDIEWGLDCIPRLVKRLKRCKEGTIVYAHNGGNFDFHFLLEFLPVDDCDFLCMGKRIVQVVLPWGVELRDSFSIIPKRLAAFKKSVFDYAKMEANVREKHKKEIIEYLKSDLRNNRDMVCAFLRRFPAKITLASSVFEMMKKEFGYNPGRSDSHYDAKFRSFFFGGRVEFWELGELKGKFSIADINSCYPAAMTQNHWFGCEHSTGTKIPAKNAEQSFYVVECYSDGALPFREKHGGISFPSRKDRYECAGWELIAGLKLGLIKQLKILICYTPVEVKSMRAFSETLYGRKNRAKIEGDTEEEFFNKIAVNAGYGKLALNVARFSEVKVTSLYDKPEQWKSKLDKKRNPEKPDWENCWDDVDRGLSFWKRPSYREGIDKFINVATAASITSCARAFLLTSKAKCKRAIYTDTDCIIAENIDRLKMSDALGDWKLELRIDTSKSYQYKDEDGKTQTHQSGLWIAGKKLYAAFGLDGSGKPKWKIASKGVAMTADKIIEVARGKYMTKTFTAPTFSFFSAPKFVTREVKRADMPTNPARKTLRKNAKAA